MSKINFNLLAFFILGVTVISAQESVKYYFTNTGTLSFQSVAPQEVISATSNEMRGLIDVEKKTFTFKVYIRSFKGFNSALQAEHFNEKYLESDKFPEAVFSGKIIEDVDLLKNGRHIIRAKGKLNIHGVERERIIKSNIVITDESVILDSQFIVMLSEHNIKIPKVVHEKIASEIAVSVKAVLRKKPAL
ncbi:MAG: YceI family protein [Bacteroidetes bacterium]|nr:MAG: YceI family protein [Bacteroidota bacterium]REK05286.1 MAG: YceI family protein [Bacteroidota bacterium]REK32691.1 MAG: YceI family protein [Bacteroidota bacterium]REK48862.1 MAG: YceI family protein [Bacteroidota bacterium]